MEVCLKLPSWHRMPVNIFVVLGRGKGVIFSSLLSLCLEAEVKETLFVEI